MCGIQDIKRKAIANKENAKSIFERRSCALISRLTENK